MTVGKDLQKVYNLLNTFYREKAYASEKQRKAKKNGGILEI